MSFQITANTTNNLTRAALKIHFEKLEAKKAFKRLLILSLVLSTVWFQGSFDNIWTHFITFALGICIFFNLLYFIKTFVKLLLKKPIYGTEEQRKFLNFNENTMFFKIKKSILKAPIKSAGSCLQVACFATLEKQKHRRNFQYVSLLKKLKRHRRKLEFQRNKTRTLNSYDTIICPKYLYKQPSYQDFMADEQSLKAYLKNYEKIQEAKNNDYTNQQYMDRLNVKSHAARMLETSVYQLATQSIERSPSFITDCLNNLQTEILQHISFDQLSQHIHNLRRWISITILKPLIKEIDDLNSIFDRLGLSELKIGTTGLKNLRSLVSQTQFVTEHAYSLPLVMAFLEICPNQIYLLERLRSLSNGSCLGSFTCRTDNSIQGRNLPNDTVIIFKCICTYLDSQLLPFVQCNGRFVKPFYDNYVILNSGDLPVRELQRLVQNRAGCALLFTDPLRPNFHLITKEKLYDGQSGFNNLFHILLGFITFLKRNNDGMLDGISLGQGGINVLWVVGESN